MPEIPASDRWPIRVSLRVQMAVRVEKLIFLQFSRAQVKMILRLSDYRIV